MLAYQRSSCELDRFALLSKPTRLPADSAVRFWGWSENDAELARSKKEDAAMVAAGMPVHGDTDLSDYQQGVAARNSTWSQLKFSAIPW
jgi:hypothetical protein